MVIWLALGLELGFALAPLEEEEEKEEEEEEEEEEEAEAMLELLALLELFGAHLWLPILTKTFPQQTFNLCRVMYDEGGDKPA